MKAWVDGRWVMLDSTWDSGNKYKNGTYTPGTIKHTYFDNSLAFSQTHLLKKTGEYDESLMKFDFNVKVDGISKRMTGYVKGQEVYIGLLQLAEALDGTTAQFQVAYNGFNGIAITRGQFFEQWDVDKRDFRDSFNTSINTVACTVSQDGYDDFTKEISMYCHILGSAATPQTLQSCSA